MSPASTVWVDWDKENDVLYVLRKNAPKKTSNVDITPGIVGRLDPLTHEIVGLIIHHFSKKLPDAVDINEWALMEFFDLIFEMLNSRQKAFQRG
jgi:hypothetical protein